MIHLNQPQGEVMTLSEYFLGKPRGSKAEMAKALGFSKTWLSLVISGRQLASPEMCVAIEIYTKGKVRRKEIRPDIFGELK